MLRVIKKTKKKKYPERAGTLAKRKCETPGRLAECNSANTPVGFSRFFLVAVAGKPDIIAAVTSHASCTTSSVRASVLFPSSGVRASRNHCQRRRCSFSPRNERTASVTRSSPTKKYPRSQASKLPRQSNLLGRFDLADTEKPSH